MWTCSGRIHPTIRAINRTATTICKRKFLCIQIKMKKILVIDSGTTNTKVFVYTINVVLKEEKSCPTKISFPKSGWVEQNAEDWFSSAVSGIKELKSKKEIECISGSFQGGTFVLLDKRLKPLRPAITWLDNRGKDIAKKLEKKYGQDYFYKKTGHKLIGWAPVAVLKWIKKNEPEIWKKTVRISFVADYLNYKLTGNFFLDPTSAAMASLFNIRKMKWDEDLLKIAGIKKEMMPDIIQSNKSGGKLKKKVANLLGFPDNIPVFAGGHDQYCASLGAGAIGSGKALISCGTAWAFLLATEKIVYDTYRQLSPGPHLFEKWQGLMGAVGNGGVIFDWGLKNLHPCLPVFPRLSRRNEVKAEAGRIKERGKGNFSGNPSDIIVLPNFTKGKGSILNLSLSTGSSDILFAISETLCFQTKEMVESAGKIFGKEKIKELIMIGGGAKNTVVPQILANITDLKVQVPEVKEAAGRGAALLTIVKNNDLSELRKFSLSCKTKTYYPDKKFSQLYKSKYKTYLHFKEILK